MNLSEQQHVLMEYAIKDGNLFYASENDSVWKELVEGGYAIKTSVYSYNIAYYRITERGIQALRNKSGLISAKSSP